MAGPIPSSPFSLIVALCLALVATGTALAQATSSPAAIIPVGNCNNAGAGSLRAAVVSAADGDTIDLRSLKCPRLLLTSGAISVTQDNLTVLGPTRAYTIDGNGASLVFLHSGGGTLSLRAMSIANGRHEEGAATGGCIHSDGDLRLDYVRVHGCQAFDPTGSASGGGAIAANNVALYDSEVFDNSAAPRNEVYPYGGGIWAHGDLTLVRSRISDNSAQGGYGGGAYVEGGLQIRYSEITGNYSRYYGSVATNPYNHKAIELIGSLIADNEALASGNMVLHGDSVLVANTTISGNTAASSAGLHLIGREQFVSSSTIVNNVEDPRGTGGGAVCVGALVVGGFLQLDSTIVARNRCEGEPLDIGGDTQWGEIAGSDNLVLVATRPLPPDTISANPRFSPLGDNGGRTRTHALWAGSPAIDMGNNNAGLQFDQRGPGFDRMKGARADIGAYER